MSSFLGRIVYFFSTNVYSFRNSVNYLRKVSNISE